MPIIPAMPLISMHREVKRSLTIATGTNSLSWYIAWRDFLSFTMQYVDAHRVPRSVSRITVTGRPS